jgi:UDP-N-acetylglucosamine 2-epimerase (non-hydrolysing)
VPVAHVEAGLRSFDNTMPEEINRRLTDQLCELLFVTSPEAIGYLGRESVAADGVHFVGNTMIDTLVACLDNLDAEAARAEHGLPGRYLVATLHRPFNVDSPEAAALLVKAMHQVADMAPVIMPVHPRGRTMFEAAGLAEHPGDRATGHRRQRQQPARSRRRAGVRRSGRPGPGAICRGTAAAVGRLVRPPDCRHNRWLAG